MPIRVTGQLDDRPACQLASLVEQLGVAREADERREGVAPLDQLLRDRLRDAVRHEPLGDPLGPVVRAPDALALRVVEPPLVHGGAGRLGCSLGAADVIGVEVRDRDPLDPELVPVRLAESDPRVEQRPVDHVAVDVLRPRRQRQRDPRDVCSNCVPFHHGDRRIGCEAQRMNSRTSELFSSGEAAKGRQVLLHLEAELFVALLPCLRLLKQLRDLLPEPLGFRRRHKFSLPLRLALLDA